MALEVLSKIVTYAAVLIVIGVCATFWLVLPRGLPSSSRRRVARRLRRVGVAASLAAVGGLVARAWAHTAVMFGYAESWVAGALSTVVIHSRWSHGWRWQLIAAVTCLLLFAVQTRAERRIWLMRMAASVGLAWSLTMTGHAAGDPWRMTIHGIHVLAGGLWLGTLATLTLVREAVDGAERPELFSAFSTVAMTGATALVLTGVTAAYVYGANWSNLLTMAYGRVLAGKAILAGIAMTCGFLNWRSLRATRLEPRQLVLTIELLATALIVAATGILTELEHW
jgi:putative copper export protein